MELAQNPDDLTKVFKIIESLPGRSTERILKRTRASTSGQLLLLEQPTISSLLSDRAALAALPAGTLGRAYYELTDRAKITAEGIVQASMVEREAPQLSGELKFVGERMRDTHDLWHVVTGYGTDVVGELALLAFTFAQAPHMGVGLMVGFAYLQRVPGVNATIREAYRRGKRAEYLPAIPWERLLDQPLDAVRAELGVGPPPAYTPISSAALRSNVPIARRFWTRSFFGEPS